jgi:hypothetical protein
VNELKCQDWWRRILIATKQVYYDSAKTLPHYGVVRVYLKDVFVIATVDEILQGFERWRRQIDEVLKRQIVIGIRNVHRL